MNIEEEMLEKAGKDLAREIDREVLWGMLQGIGWTRVMLPTLGNGEQAVNIIVWLEENCKKAYERSGRDFIFEDSKDANWFILRWGTV
jgi:hypothetical protein